MYSACGRDGYSPVTLLQWSNRQDIEHKVQDYQTKLRGCTMLIAVSQLAKPLSLKAHHRPSHQVRISRSHYCRSEEASECTSFTSSCLDRTTLNFGRKTLKTEDHNAPAAKSAQATLLALRTNLEADSAQLLPSKLSGECVRVGDTAVISGTYSDIWRGLWLGKVSVALKLCRDFRKAVRDDVSMKVSAFTRVRSLPRTTFRHNKAFPSPS